MSWYEETSKNNDENNKNNNENNDIKAENDGKTISLRNLNKRAVIPALLHLLPVRGPLLRPLHQHTSREVLPGAS